MSFIGGKLTSKNSIYECKNGHFFLKETCPFCESPPINFHEYRKGDCIFCGCLCPEFGYCCTDPFPLTEEDFFFDKSE